MMVHSWYKVLTKSHISFYAWYMFIMFHVYNHKYVFTWNDLLICTFDIWCVCVYSFQMVMVHRDAKLI